MARKERKLHVLPDLAEDQDYPVTLKAPGRQEAPHPILGPLPQAMNWMMAVRQLMRDQGMSLYEADQVAREAGRSHDGKGRKFQPPSRR